MTINSEGDFRRSPFPSSPECRPSRRSAAVSPRSRRRPPHSCAPSRRAQNLYLDGNHHLVGANALRHLNTYRKAFEQKRAVDSIWRGIRETTSNLSTGWGTWSRPDAPPCIVCETDLSGGKMTHTLRTCVERRRQILGGLPREGSRAEGHQHGERHKLDDAGRNVDFLHSFKNILKFGIFSVLFFLDPISCSN